MTLTPDTCAMRWEESIFDLTFLQDYPLLKSSTYDQETLMSMIKEMEHSYEPNSPFPPGTILMYSTEQSLQLDRPGVVGTVGPLVGIQSDHSNSFHVHCAIRNTVRKEFKLEDNYRRLISGGLLTLPRDKKRRNPTDCDWKPESIYKTYVDCKPEFFEKSDYQDHIPTSSCFGKINMRIPKAWSRGPNRPNRPKRRRTRKTNTSSEESNTRLSSLADQEENTQYTEASFNSQFPTISDPLAFEFLFP
ncbi:CIC11C00000004675 [Sungouiella intermedia]|uniref:CIC11C00000004675 n=1 Tax=Sungouiella intermedia TaxID=45354 RepID=A0A1L0BXY8_9ASCO|nr:CIC11C00000004675 [[Candida] intermedia]